MQPARDKHAATSAYGVMALWIFLSASVVMMNKYLMDPQLGNFPFPLTLTASHMAFCSAATFGMVWAGVAAKPPALAMDFYLRSILPLGAMFAVTLWLGNLAYIYLSVSFIQMLKAAMPLWVFAAGCVFGTESPSWQLLTNLLVVVGGVLAATLGEVRFVIIGVAAQVTAIAVEATRLTLVQVLLQGSGVKLTPISTMYYVSPVCLGCLLPPMLMLEMPRLMDASAWRVGPGMLLLSALLAFALNLSVLLFIGKTSALTLNLAGIIKDMLLISLSITLHKSHVTALQFFGYGVALAGVLWYNRQKLHAAGKQQPGQPPPASKSPAPPPDDAEAARGGRGSGRVDSPR